KRDEATKGDDAGPSHGGGGDVVTALSPEPWNASSAEDEQVTRLSPEPWAQPGGPWEQPRIWQPPPPRRRSRTTSWMTVAVTAWVTVVTVLVIVFWPDREDPAPGSPTAVA